MKGKVLCVTFVVLVAALTGFAHAQDDVWISSTPYAYVSALAYDGDYLWIGSEWGLTRLDRASGNITSYNERLGHGITSVEMTALVVDPQGTVWIGTNGAGLVKFDGANWQVFNSESSALPNDT
ncbi:unnamed protein product, partial [marine sediment metagenome]